MILSIVWVNNQCQKKKTRGARDLFGSLRSVDQVGRFHLDQICHLSYVICYLSFLAPFHTQIVVDGVADTLFPVRQPFAIHSFNDI